MNAVWVGLGGVIVGAIVAGTLGYLADRRHWRRNQVLAAQSDIYELLSAVWPNQASRHELRALKAKVRSLLSLLGVDSAVVERLEEGVTQCREAATRVPGHYWDVDQDFVYWIPPELLDKLEQEVHKLSESLVDWKLRL